MTNENEPVIEPLTKYQRIADLNRTPTSKNAKPQYEHVLEIVAGFLALELKFERKK